MKADDGDHNVKRKETSKPDNMPKQKCNCGVVINLSSIPSPYQHLIISDTAFDGFQGTVEAEAIYAKMQLMVKCPSCERLYIYEDGFGKVPKVYKREL